MGRHSQQQLEIIMLNSAPYLLLLSPFLHRLSCASQPFISTYGQTSSLKHSSIDLLRITVNTSCSWASSTPICPPRSLADIAAGASSKEEEESRKTRQEKSPQNTRACIQYHNNVSICAWRPGKKEEEATVKPLKDGENGDMFQARTFFNPFVYNYIYF